jgi:hypothetical protein
LNAIGTKITEQESELIGPFAGKEKSKRKPLEVSGGIEGGRKFEVTSPVQEKRKDVVGEDIKGNPAVRIDE